MNPSQKVVIDDLKPQKLRSAAGTFLLVIESIWLATQNGQRVNDTGFLDVETIAVDQLLRAAFINANVKLICKETNYIPTNSGFVTMEDIYREDSPIAQVDNMAEHPVYCRVTRMVKKPAISQVLVLVQVPATGFQVVETRLHL